MTERKQPVCKGVNAKGELLWGFIPMPLWQQAMFPVKYIGDFLAFWMKKKFFDQTGYENSDIPNTDLRPNAYNHLRKPRTSHPGD